MASSKQTPRRHVFTGTFIHSRTRTELGYLHNAVVCVDDRGRIARLDSNCSDLKAAIQQALGDLGWPEDQVTVQSCEEGQFFFPGFIDTHIHASQYPNAGIFGKSTLMDWLDTYTFPLEASLADLTKARRVYNSCIRRTLAHGTTTAAYYATRDVAATNLLADLCLSAGQRAFVGRVCMDNAKLCPDYYCDETAEEGLNAARKTIEHIREIDPSFAIVSPIITPRFALACTGDSMRGLAGLQREFDIPAQTHISENPGEVDLVAEMFPDAGSYAAVYDKFGLLNRRTVLAHAVHLSEEEAALVASRGSCVSHCPCSNSSLTSGAARVRWLWDRGVLVGLGTDVSGGYSPSILEAARQAALVSRHVAMGDDARSKLAVEEVLYLATRAGAECLGLGERVGSFEVGMDWDAQLICLGGVLGDGDNAPVDGEVNGDEGDATATVEDQGNVDIFGWETWEEKMAKWLYNGDDRNTKKVWVKGRLVHARR